MSADRTVDRSAPIGVFDSGVGGLTVARAVIDQLPTERVRYIGDTAHAPYGPRPVEEIRSCALDVADSLVESGVKLLVIACNSAAAAGVTELAQNRYDLPVLEVIAPAVRRALAVSRTGHIGVIGTTATIESGAYPRAFAAAGGPHPATVYSGAFAAVGGPDLATVYSEALAAASGPTPPTVYSHACPSFVDFVERGITAGRQITGLAQAYLGPLQAGHIDTLVLGCTHYPLLAGVLQLVMGERVTLVSSADETAKDVFRVLTELDLLAAADPTGEPAKHEFLATGDQPAFDRLGRRFLGPEIVATTPW